MRGVNGVWSISRPMENEQFQQIDYDHVSLRDVALIFGLKTCNGHVLWDFNNSTKRKGLVGRVMGGSKCWVMWPDETGCPAGASAGHTWSVMLFVLCFPLLCSQTPLTPLHPWPSGMLKFTPHCPTCPTGLPPWNNSLIFHLHPTNLHLHFIYF